ncbi:hypothetical protein NLM27_28170 [Bradyrhizobium sp. CCGB12]|uniref:hypothetical protein n=1 Tax=Bradyrhizobium sp. CCGB12 TaxID=2949632 RepID=UPI0020B29F89|nr:hypothetical protein [Bradyrhizobium sp. CCGB12]MCP3392628.1 hypothetical protein [Bradyrhizobium sp. CCGB12]
MIGTADAPALRIDDVSSVAAATAIFRFNVCMLVMLTASCGADILLHLAGGI